VNAVDHRKAALARRGLHEDAKVSKLAGMSAAEWEERVAEQAADSAALIGRQALDAIVQVVWFKNRRRSRGAR
jgi:hypothetical protein